MQVCSSYTVNKLLFRRGAPGSPGAPGIPNHFFLDYTFGESTSQPLCTKNNGSCQIDSPSFALKGQCYPERHFCIQQVVCPSTHRASIGCSSLDLPKDSDGKNIHI